MNGTIDSEPSTGKQIDWNFFKVIRTIGFSRMSTVNETPGAPFIKLTWVSHVSFVLDMSPPTSP
jgi:hypothetical protein